jgi:excisionase family DNA binding protein
MTDYLTTSQAAAILGLTPGRVRQLLRAGALPYIGDAHRLIARADVEAFAAIPRKPGRK